MRASLAAVLLALATPAVAGVAITGNEIVQGFTPGLAVTGLLPNERVRVHSLRMFAVWQEQPGKGWRPAPRAIHAWADYRADAKGEMRLDAMSPLAGTFSGIDPYGMLWSGQPVGADGDPYLPEGVDAAKLAENESRILVSRGGKLLATAKLTSRPPLGLVEQEVAEGRLNGAFAAPADGLRHPALILLHGSEGASRSAAKDMARRFAGQGYAAFAFNYFAWDLSKIEGIPNAHVNQPIEMLAKVRDWLAKRPEADVTRLGLYGHSKGAEYAELAATRLPWIDAVVACVPTDVVWEGYGIGDGRNKPDPNAKEPAQYSSFSWRGRPLNYIPLKGDRKPFHSNTDFYEFKRKQMGAGAAAAAIPVERSRASFLFLGGGRDEVWNSGAMAQNLDKRMRAAGKASDSEMVVYERAGHAICGEGVYPIRVWQNDSPDPRDPDLDANGRATVDAWNRTKEFFERRLKSR